MKAAYSNCYVAWLCQKLSKNIYKNLKQKKVEQKCSSRNRSKERSTTGGLVPVELRSGEHICAKFTRQIDFRTARSRRRHLELGQIRPTTGLMLNENVFWYWSIAELAGDEKIFF